MTDNQIRVLFCLLHGETAFFQVKAHVDNSVLELKELIREKKHNTLRNFDANELFLYQVNNVFTIADAF
jgi:hypothetical protein